MSISEIIYNSTDVDMGKSILVNIPTQLLSISNGISAGINEIKASGFKGKVNIDTKHLPIDIQNIETVITDIEYAEQKIKSFTEENPNWAKFEYNGTKYSNVELGIQQANNELHNSTTELENIQTLIDNGQTSEQVIKRAQQLSEQIPGLQQKSLALKQEAVLEKKLEISSNDTIQLQPSQSENNNTNINASEPNGNQFEKTSFSISDTQSYSALTSAPERITATKKAAAAALLQQNVEVIQEASEPKILPSEYDKATSAKKAALQALGKI